MIKRYFLVAILPIAGCDIAINAVGYGVPLSAPVKPDCIGKVIVSHDSVSEFNRTDGKYSFVVNRYKIQFEYQTVDGLVASYNMDINGMFLGEELGVFYKNAYETQQNMHKAIENAC